MRFKSLKPALKLLSILTKQSYHIGEDLVKEHLPLIVRYTTAVGDVPGDAGRSLTQRRKQEAALTKWVAGLGKIGETLHGVMLNR